MPQPLVLKNLKSISSMKTTRRPPRTPKKKKKKKDVLFIVRDCNAKIGSQEILGVIGKFGLRVQNEAGQRLTGFCQHQQHKYPSPATQETALHMDITKWLIPKSD